MLRGAVIKLGQTVHKSVAQRVQIFRGPVGRARLLNASSKAAAGERIRWDTDWHAAVDPGKTCLSFSLKAYGEDILVNVAAGVRVIYAPQ